MKKLILVTLIAVTVIAAGLHAQQAQPKLKLVWQKEYNAAIQNFTLLEGKGSPTLGIMLTENEIQYSNGKSTNLKSGNEGYFYSNIKSKNGKYIGIHRELHSDNGFIRDGLFSLYNSEGKIITEIKYKEGRAEDHKRPGLLLNNGNYIISLNDQGCSHFAIIDKNTDKIIKEFRPIDDFYSSGHIDFAEKEDLFVICTVGTEKVHEGLVVLYDYSGNEIWRRSLGGGWTGTVAISPFGNYVAALGNEVTTLFTFNNKGDLLWKLDVDVADII